MAGPSSSLGDRPRQHEEATNRTRRQPNLSNAICRPSRCFWSIRLIVSSPDTSCDFTSTTSAVELGRWTARMSIDPRSPYTEYVTSTAASQPSRSRARATRARGEHEPRRATDRDRVRAIAATSRGRSRAQRGSTEGCRPTACQGSPVPVETRSIVQRPLPQQYHAASALGADAPPAPQPRRVGRPCCQHCFRPLLAELPANCEGCGATLRDLTARTERSSAETAYRASAGWCEPHRHGGVNVAREPRG
jgi:hypothetical protein